MHFRPQPQVLILFAAASIPLAAGGVIGPDCRVVLDQERIDRDGIALELDLARSELVAAEEVFALLDKLWKNDATERLRYLSGKHQRDRASIDVGRLEQVLARQNALIEQYRLICESDDRRSPADDERRAIDSAWREYRLAQCKVHVHDRALAEVDLAYDLEVLASFRDLRQHDVATRQDIVFSERDVEMSRKRLAQADRLVEACQSTLEGDEQAPATAPQR